MPTTITLTADPACRICYGRGLITERMDPDVPGSNQDVECNCILDQLNPGHPLQIDVIPAPVWLEECAAVERDYEAAMREAAADHLMATDYQYRRGV